MMKKLIILSLLVSLFAFPVISQQTMIYTHPDYLFNQGKELFAQRKFAASYRNFEEFLKQTENIQAGQIQEAEFYLAANSFELRKDNAEARLKAFFYKHPYTPFYDKTNLMLGMLEYEKKKYSQALAYFNNIEPKRLGMRERTDYLFCKGYASLQTKNYVQALEIFKELKSMNTRYNLSATYYYAYSEYTLENYQAALPEFLKIENNQAYKNIVPYYIAQIFYAQKEYDKFNERADFLLKNNPDNKNNGEIYRILGEIAYQKKNYTSAIANFKKYEELIPQVLRNDMYLLGLSYYQTKNYKNAIQYLSKTVTERDELTENTYLHLGNAYLKINDKTNARLSYEASIRTNFNKSVREEALYNYALTTYETTSAFGESVSAFEQFLYEFPNSKYTNQAYDYLASALMTTKNYESAYQTILKIRTPNAKLLETKQYLLYQLGTEAFTQGNLNKAIEYFTMSLQNAPIGKYSAESLFWRSESYFRTNNNDKSISDLKTFFDNSNSKTSINRKIANYSMAYAYFSQKDYSSALTWFLKYIDLETSTGNTTYADALNRIGDCYFNARNFSKAETFYTRASSVSPNTGDYAIFQSAYAAGLQSNYTTKISRLETLISKYPNSEYVDDALYEIGRSYIMLENDNKAISAFQRLLDLQPNSNLTRKAAYEIGMIYFNDGKYEQAIAAYKQVIAKYPGSQEARTALESLESVYVEINDVASYVAYTKTLGVTIGNSTAVREDSISYVAAERQYINGNYSQAINGMLTYLKNYCSGGRYCTNAQYYLADSYYKTNDKVKALPAYQALLRIGGNQFIEEAAMRCAEITYDEKDYASALQYFKQLQTVAQTTENRNIGRLGVLRCSYFLNDHQTTINIANEIFADFRSSDVLKSEARYNRAKAYIALNQINMALSDLKTLAADTRTANGAEAKYMLANIYFDQGKLGDSEKEILDFAKKNTPYQYWLARSFVLLSDIYIKQGNDFQAKQYLLSLQRNYTEKDEIQDMISERLQGIADRESKSLIK
ncbi:MAG: tetratricopeptide repeat protein [Paludibacter sp.]|nr:tetratricopeptide repeat protein [Paludibacter sp.]